MAYDTLIIPVESQVREFDAKLLLALIAAEKGYTVYLGSRAYTHFYASKLKNAVYLAKSMRRFSDRMFKILHDLGHRIVAWDEEALVRLPDEQYFRHRLSEKNAKYIDLLFAWGENNAQTFRNFAPYQNIPVHITGNPRSDLLRKELRGFYHAEMDQLLDQYGSYFLINTNFGQVNHYLGNVGKNEAARDLNYDNRHGSTFISERLKHKTVLFKHFQYMIKDLAEEFSEMKFIVRPHPSESVNFWHNLYQDIPNIIIENQGNVLPWIFASSGVIANSCTTLVEAAISGIPAIGYYPVTNKLIDDALPKSICIKCTDINQLKETVSDMSQNSISEYFLPTDSVIYNHVNIPEQAFVCEEIIEIIQRHYSTLNSYQNSLTRTIGIAHNTGRTIVKKINRIRKNHRGNQSYHQHRYPIISAKELNQKYQKIKNSLNGRFKYVKITQQNAYIYKMES